MRLCPDCLDTEDHTPNPAPDQRAWVKNGRCRDCTREIYRARRHRARIAAGYVQVDYYQA